MHFLSSFPHTSGKVMQLVLKLPSHFGEKLVQFSHLIPKIQYKSQYIKKNDQILIKLEYFDVLCAHRVLRRVFLVRPIVKYDQGNRIFT